MIQKFYYFANVFLFNVNEENLFKFYETCALYQMWKAEKKNLKIKIFSKF